LHAGRSGVVWNLSTSFSCFALPMFLALVAPRFGMASALALPRHGSGLGLGGPVLSSMILVSSARLFGCHPSFSSNSEEDEEAGGDRPGKRRRGQRS
jgi:hypothetical protein